MGKLKIVLLTTKWDRELDNVVLKERRPFHGLGYLYKILTDAGHEVKFIDRFYGSKERTNFGKGYDVFGVYANVSALAEFYYIVEKVKNQKRAPKLIIGGPAVKLRKQEFLETRADHIVEGEAEHIITDLIEGNIKDRYIKADRLSNKDLDNLPRAPYELFYGPLKELYDLDFTFSNANPVFSMNTSRGCPWNCSFCTVRKVWGKKVTWMSPERIVDDVEYIKKLGAKGIFFREDNFTFNKKRVIDFCELLLKKNIKIDWAIETRIDSVDEEMMELMTRAGLVGCFVGVEALTDRMLEIFNKGITVSQILKFFEISHKYGVNITASFLLEHPEETEYDIKERQRLMKVIHPKTVKYHWHRNRESEVKGLSKWRMKKSVEKDLEIL